MHPIEVVETDAFSRWLDDLRDDRARARVLARIHRLAFGNAGDARPIGGGLSELRIDHGPGYRIYFVRRGPTLVILLAGGDKGSQSRDILRARQLANALGGHP